MACGVPGICLFTVCGMSAPMQQEVTATQLFTVHIFADLTQCFAIHCDLGTLSYTDT